MAKIKDKNRIIQEEFKQTKGFLRSHFRDPSMKSEDWRLVEKGVKEFQKLTKGRDEDDLVQVVKSMKDNFTTNPNSDRIPIRIVYGLILSLIIIPDGKGGTKEYKPIITEIITSVIREKAIHHYDTTAITKAGKEYKSLIEPTETNENNENNLQKPVNSLYAIMSEYRA